MNDMLADAGDRPEPLPRSSLPAERAEVTGILRRLASEHLTLAVTGLFSLWSVIVLLRVSDWDPLTAKAILEQSGTANVLLGTLVSFITGYLPSAIAITIGVLLHEHAAGRRKLNVWAFSGLLCCGGILLARANFLWGLSFGLLMVISLASGEWRWHGA